MISQTHGRCTTYTPDEEYNKWVRWVCRRDMLDTKNKMLCMDTGHTHKAHCVKPSVLDTVDAIRYLGKDIKLLHLNDNNGYFDQHLPPCYAGSELGLVWKNVFAALDEIGYDGVCNFELTLGHYGKVLNETVAFLGKYLRRVADGTMKQNSTKKNIHIKATGVSH